MTTQRSRSEILDEVEDLAYEVRKYDSEVSIEAARSIVFEELPELYEEYVSSPTQVPSQPISKAEREPTVRDEILVAVRKRAGELAWTEWPTKTLEDIEWDVWNSAEGQQLYSLYTSDQGRVPVSQVEHRIAKAAGWDAWSVLREWRVG